MCLLLRNIIATFRLRMTVGQWPTAYELWQEVEAP
jgi:hypothetical protein